jgi:hypothetical protein
LTTLPIADTELPPVPSASPSQGRVLRITDRTLTLDDMLRFAGRTGYTGELRVEASSAGELLIESGRVVAAHLSGGVERDDVLARRAGDDRSEAAVASAVLEHVVEVLLELELATTGTTTLELVSGEPGLVPRDVALDVDDVLEAKHGRLREWKQIAARMPPANASVRLAVNLAPGDIAIDGDDWRVVRALRDGATVAHIVRAVGIGAFCACRSVLRLLDAGAIEVVVEPPGDNGDKGTS